MNQVGYINVTIPTQNYEDISVKLSVGITDKHDRLPPELMDFDMVFTNKGSDITATIVAELSEVEFSFDGVNWSDVNTASVGHEQSVTGYIRFVETEIYNVSQASSRTGKTGHDTRTRGVRLHKGGQGCVKVDEDGAAVISGADAAGEYIVMVCEYSDLSGNMNNDGVSNALDASAILKYIVGIAA